MLVGAPADDGNIDTTDGSSKISNDGTVHCYDLNTTGQYAWKNIASETALIDTEKLGQVFQFNKQTKALLDYFNLYDPVKGHILGVADREIKYKSPWDPAMYNSGASPNIKTAWDENHVGEVWWDLSKVKWLWYEQGTQEYKFNNWGKTFPGSSIDIYAVSYTHLRAHET